MGAIDRCFRLCRAKRVVFDFYNHKTVLFDFDKNQIGRLNSDGKLIINNNINLWNGYTESCKECNVYPVCLGRKCLGGALKNKKPKCSYDVIVKSIKDIVCASYD